MSKQSKQLMRLTCAAAVFLASLASASAESSNPVIRAESDVRLMVAGHTVYLKTNGIELPILYNVDGSMSGRLPGFAAAVAYARELPATDTGRWWTEGNRLCQRWTQWHEGKAFCYTFRRRGDKVLWQRHDGRTGTARLKD